MRRQYPEAFLTRMEAQLGADYPAFCAALEETSKKALHINAIKTDRETLSALLGLPLPALSENPDGVAAFINAVIDELHETIRRQRHFIRQLDGGRSQTLNLLHFRLLDKWTTNIYIDW